METYIDLHTHSKCSDGTLTPLELIAYAQKKKLSAIALTDHDTVAGIREAYSAAKSFGIELVTGIEFSTNYMNKDIHILGYDFDAGNAHFQEHIQNFQDSRLLRNHKIIDKLREHQIPLSMEILEETFPDAVITRAHLGKYLVMKGYVKTITEAFDKYLGDNAPCFVPREKVSPHQAISVIHEAGGYAVLAHPLRYNLSSEKLENLVATLAKSGIDGIEAIYSTNRFSDTSAMKQMAKRYQLAISGGSDFHGSNKPHIDLGIGMGNLKIPYSVLAHLREKPPKIK